ncbi:MAG: DUF4058 family protein [Chloroflexota bacterium]
MSSPFPGMDPYLEGYLWPDLHHRLATQISDQLAPLIQPRYVARIVMRTVVEQMESGESVGVMLPDVEIFNARRVDTEPFARGGLAVATNPIAPAPLVLPQPLTYEVEIPSVEIRDVAGGILVTSIEILSPTNKTGTGWDEYQVKRRKVLQAQAHLLEIDFIRRGRRPIPTMSGKRAPYYIFLTRAQRRDRVEVWPIQLRDALPIIPVPLRAPEPDVPLDLSVAFGTVYDRARYDLSLDYHLPPNPPLNDADAEWARGLLVE